MASENIIMAMVKAGGNRQVHYCIQTPWREGYSAEFCWGRAEGVNCTLLTLHCPSIVDDEKRHRVSV